MLPSLRCDPSLSRWASRWLLRSNLVKALEDIRYYHKAADVYDLGYGGILVEAFDEDSDGDHYWEGSVLIPSRRDRLIYKSAAYQDEPVQGALFWGWGYFRLLNVL